VEDLSHLPDLDEKLVGAAAKSKRFPAYYEAVAKLHGCHYLNSQEFVKTSRIDGLHLEVEEHAKLGRAMAEAVRQAFRD
jgi:lysophospholipase L1-like esterase